MCPQDALGAFYEDEKGAYLSTGSTAVSPDPERQQTVGEPALTPVAMREQVHRTTEKAIPGSVYRLHPGRHEEKIQQS